MAYPSFRATVTKTSYTGATVTVNKPTGTASGDVLLCVFEDAQGTRTLDTLPDGWSIIASASAGGSRTAGFWLCKKVAGGSEPASYDFSFSATFYGRAEMFAVQDGSDVSAVGTAAYSSAQASSPYNITASSITVPDNETLLVFVGATIVTTLGADPAHTPPSGFTERVDAGEADEVRAITVADKQVSAGASGEATGTVAWASAGDAKSVGVLVAIAPVGGSSSMLASGSVEFPVISSVALDSDTVTTAAGNTSDQVVTVKDQGGIGLSYLTGTPTSSDEAVATVEQLAATDANGQATVRITTLAAGTATIAIAFDGVSDSLALTVVSAGQSTRSISPSSVTLDLNETQQFVAYADGVQTTPVWTVPVGAGTITSAGLYTAPGSVGTATVRASDPADPAQYAEAAVTIAVVEYGTASVTWASAANLTLDYFVFDKYDELIASGSAAFDSTGSADLRVPVAYIGDPVLVAVNNLGFDMETAGKVHGQKVVTVV